MTIKIEKPGAQESSAEEFAPLLDVLHAWVDRDPPARNSGAAVDPLYSDLAPSVALQHSLSSRQLSADAFVTAYEVELDGIPRSRFSVLIERARRRELVLVSSNTLAAHALSRYLSDMAAMTATDDARMNAAARRFMGLANAAYGTKRAEGCNHARAMVASRTAVESVSA